MYSWVKKGFDFYIRSSIHVAFAIYALLQVTCLTFQLPYSEPLNYTVFYGSILGYNFIKYGNLWRVSPKPFAKRPYLIISLISTLAMSYYFIKLDSKTMICIGVGAVLSLFYSIPFYKNKSLRQLSNLKIYIVALTWVISTAIVPFVHFDTSFTLIPFLHISIIFIWILCLMIPFEIRDYYDDPTHLNTLPQKYGLTKTKHIGISLVVLLLGFLVLFYNLEVYNLKTNDEVLFSFILPIKKTLLTQGLIYIITMLFIIFSKIEQSKYYSSFWVEALPILWWMLLVFV